MLAVWMALKKVGLGGGLFFKKNRIASRIIHLLATFLWIKKKMGKVSLFSDIY